MTQMQVQTLECVICLQAVNAGGDEEGVVLSCASEGCTAVFHAECAKQAWASSHRCPQCRRQVSSALKTVMSLAHESGQSSAAVERMRKEVERLRLEGQTLRGELVEAQAAYQRVIHCAQLLEQQMLHGFQVTNSRLDECGAFLSRLDTIRPSDCGTVL